jgi:hypothetical protein
VKKFSLVFIVAATFVAFSFSQTTVRTEIAGYTKINLEPGGKYTLATCNFQAGETNTLISVFGTNQLTQSDNYISCDRIILWNSSGQLYQAWAQWTDGVFYKANNLTEWNAGISGDPEIPVGKGFFISSGNISNTLWLSGNVITVVTQNVTMAAGFQIVGNPFSCPVGIQVVGEQIFNCGAATDDSYLDCDRIHIWENDHYQSYALWTDGIFYKANNLAEWNLGIPAIVNIELGQGYFYEARAPFTWVSTNAYLSAIQD